MNVWVNPDTHCLASYTVSIFGSLRDCDSEDADRIIEWFKSKISLVIARNAVIDVESGCSAHKIWVYNPDNITIENKV